LPLKEETVRAPETTKKTSPFTFTPSLVESSSTSKRDTSKSTPNESVIDLPKSSAAAATSPAAGDLISAQKVAQKSWHRCFQHCKFRHVKKGSNSSVESAPNTNESQEGLGERESTE